MACSELFWCLHSLGFSLGHVETKPSPSQDYEKLEELSSPDGEEGLVRQGAAGPLVRASPAWGGRGVGSVWTCLARFCSFSPFPGSQVQQAPRPEAEQGQGPEGSPGHSPRGGGRLRLGKEGLNRGLQRVPFCLAFNCCALLFPPNFTLKHFKPTEKV